MSVIVRVGQVDDGEKVYKVGDIIEGLNEGDEQELLAAGVVDVIKQEYSEERNENKEPIDPPASDNEEEDAEDELEPEDEAAAEGPNISIPGLDDAPKNKRSK